MALSLSCSLNRFSQKCVPHHTLSASDRGFRIHVLQAGHLQSGACRRIQVWCSTGASSTDRATDFNALSAVPDAEYYQLPSNYETVTELPPLIPSLVNVVGLPPLARASAWEAETQRQLLEVAERWKTPSLKLWIPPGVLWTSFIYSQVVSLDRFVVISFITTVLFMLDDFFFDCPKDSLLEEFGIHGAVKESPETIMAYLRNLWLLFDRDAPLKENAVSIEGLMWECGEVMRRFSNPEWFKEFSAALLTSFEATVACEIDYREGRFRQYQDVEAYTIARRRNSGGYYVVLLLEYSMNAYLTNAVRTHPIFVQLHDRAIVHMMFTNDVFSYVKESMEEPDNPRNLVKVMVDVEGMALPQAAWRAVDIINANARAVMELENRLLACDEATPGILCPWTYELKRMMTGNIYYHLASKRYLVKGSVFPECELLDPNQGLVDPLVIS